jgi:hypothetical protein
MTVPNEGGAQMSLNERSRSFVNGHRGANATGVAIYNVNRVRVRLNSRVCLFF